MWHPEIFIEQSQLAIGNWQLEMNQ